MSVLYVFGEPGMLLVKVGISSGLKGRVQALKKLYPDGEVLYLHSRGSGLAERRAHRILKHRYWLDGEWFVCGADIAASAVRQAVKVQDRIQRDARRFYAAKRKRLIARRRAEADA